MFSFIVNARPKVMMMLMMMGHECGSGIDKGDNGKEREERKVY
jgi:hypothetical protein